MDRRLAPVVARAVSLARSGRFGGMVELKRVLLAEGWVGRRNGGQIFHWRIRRQLLEIMRQAREEDLYDF